MLQVTGAAKSSMSAKPMYDYGASLVVVAGSGLFPVKLIEKAKSKGQKVFLCAHVGEVDSSLTKLCDDFIWVKVGQLGKIISFAKKSNAKQLIFTGAISRARLFVSAFPDWRAIKVIKKAGSLKDDKVLRAITEEVESEGIHVYSSAEVLTDFLTSPGCYTNRSLSKEEKADAIVGWDAAKTLGSIDVGQTAVVVNGLVVALECVEGTDACIKRAGDLCSKKPSVIVKVPKPQQDKRLDLPSIGLGTIQTMIESGATALVLESGGAMILNPDEVVRAANKAGIAVISVTNREKILEDFYKKETS